MMRGSIIGILILCMVSGVRAQQSEFDSLVRTSKTAPAGIVEQHMRLFEDGIEVEKLFSRITYYQNVIHHEALPIEVYTGRKYKVVLEHESKQAFLLPLADSLPPGRRVDSLLVMEMTDSIGQRTATDSQGFYLDISFLPEHPYQSIRLFYDSKYQIYGYDLTYNAHYLRGVSDRRIECRMAFTAVNNPVFDWSALIVEKDGVVSLTPKYKKYELINLLAD